MNTLSIKVESSPGRSCREAIQDMCALANRLNIRIDCKMNDVTIMAKPQCDPQALGDAFEKEMGSKNPFKIVCGQPVATEEYEKHLQAEFERYFGSPIVAWERWEAWQWAIDALRRSQTAKGAEHG